MIIKWRPEIREHLEAAHFNVFPWISEGKLVWSWQRGDDPEAKVLDSFSTQRAAEDAAVEWYESVQKLKMLGL